MKQGIIGSLLAVLFGFCLLPSVANTWTCLLYTSPSPRDA